jgi:hypothetical protein
MRTLVAAVILGAAVAGSVAFTQDRDAQSERAFRQEMRRLWIDHDTYLRHLTISTAGGLSDAAEVSKRLQRSAEDLGKAFETYLGDKRGEKIGSLLRIHGEIAADLVKAARAGQDEHRDSLVVRMTENSRDIARYLASVNPNWNKDDIEKRLRKRLDLKNDEIDCRLKSDWTGDIKAADRGRDQLMELSDLLSTGIVKQYPTKFKAP